MTQRLRARMIDSVCVAGLFVLVFFVDALSPISTSLDSIWTIPVALNLLDRGTTHVDEYLTPTKDPQNARFPGLFLNYTVECVTSDGAIVRGEACSHGHYFNWYPVAVPVLAAPVLFALRKAGPILSPTFQNFANQPPTPVMRAFAAGDFIMSRGFTEVVVATVFVALTTVATFLIGRLFLSHWWSTLFALAFAFATPAWSSASRALWQHGPSMLMLSIALYVLLLARHNTSSSEAVLLSVSGVATALAYVIRPTNSIWAGAVTLYILLCHRKRFLWFFVTAAPVAVTFLLYNESVYHRLLPTYFVLQLGQPKLPQDTIPILKALAGVLASPSRGLLIYSPLFCFSVWGMVWAISRRWCAPLALLLVGVIAGNVLVLGYYFRIWWGGHSYGPRLLTDITPFLMFFLIPALVSWQESATWPPKAVHLTFIALLGASVFSHSRGARSADVYKWNSLPVDVEHDTGRLWDWRDPPFLRGLSREQSPPTLTQNLQRVDRVSRYSVDQVDADCEIRELQTGIFCSNMFLVSGWAVDPDDGTAGGVEVVLDNKLYSAHYGLKRPDVAAHFKDTSYERSGFYLSMPADQLSKGLHRFSVRIIDKSKTSYFESSPVAVALMLPAARSIGVEPAGTATARGEVEGALDVVDSEQIAGWAWEKSHPDGVLQVDIYDGDSLLVRVPAGVFRQDLLDANKGDGTHAFSCPNPFAFQRNAIHTIRAFVSGKELAGSPKTFPQRR